MNKKIKIIYATIFLTISFLAYSFFPILTYKQSENKPGNIYLVDRFWKVITDKQTKWWYKKADLIDLNSKLVKSIVKIEDKDFYNNYWVSIKSKLRALYQNIKYQKIISWGSTITEQYIKNKYFSLERRTILEKLREALVAFVYDISHLKKDILLWYLHNVYMWNNLYWIDTAAKVYFNKDIKSLSDEQITILVSLINNPWVKSLDEKHFQKYFSLVKNRLWFNFKRKIFKLNKLQNIDKLPFVTQRVLDKYPNHIWDFKTSIDLDFSIFVKKQLNKVLKDLKKNNVTNWAVLIIDPKTQEVLVYQGSKDFHAQDIDWQVDVIKAKRQPWSTLKPFLYLLALKSGADIDKFILDIESQYNSFRKNKVYISENYSLKEYGLVRLKKAIWNSLNNASVRLAKELWLKKVWNFFKSYWLKLDYPPEYYWYSMVLWNPDISLENLVLSYINLLPNYVIHSRKLQFFHWTSDYNELVYKRNKLKNDKIDPEKFLLYQILKNPDNRDISFWVNSILNTSIYQAVKTGTSSDFRDNWIVSYNPDLIVWIWMWNNDNSSMKWVTWITWAWYLWHQIITYAIKKHIIQDKNYTILKQIEKFYYCLDKKCNQKEASYKKKQTKYYSAIKDWIFDKKDIYEKLDDYEKRRLKELGYEIR